MPKTTTTTTSAAGEQKQQQNHVVLADQSISAAGRSLLLDNNNDDTDSSNKGGGGGASIVLFYQYKEPVWTSREFQKALKLFLSLGRKYEITGRGRIAPEGVNCTLTAPTSKLIRSFCQSLRDDWNIGDDKSNDDTKLFHDTDFKITDGLPQSQKFKSLSLRKVDELVAYGLEGEKAPSITKFGGQHLTAVDYHEALADPQTVVIDVRNNYETQIGTIHPPPGGATLLDPKLRNSREWPKWLASKETQKQLNGKKILTFCTGGIRCERATALINQMSTVSSANATTDKNKNEKSTIDSLSSSTTSTTSTTAFQPNGVYHMRGGIERYLKTYPQGGYWSGKNYLFDKRMEQVPEFKDSLQIENEVTSKLQAKCCVCRKPWTSYRNQYKCHQIQCGVPVLVCDICHNKKSENQNQLKCELCREGYRAPQGNPDLIALKIKAEKIQQASLLLLGVDNDDINAASTMSSSGKKQETKNYDDGASSSLLPQQQQKLFPPRKLISDRLFISRLPLNVTKSQIEKWLQIPIRQYHWLSDVNTGAFYGSCIVRVDVFSKLMLTINKNKSKNIKKYSANNNNNNSPNKVNENESNGTVRELLGLFPAASPNTSASTNTNNTTQKRKRPRHQQQPKIFRVLAKQKSDGNNDKDDVVGDVWPPLNHCQTEYPPLGGKLTKSNQ
jgi:predicted sulfurtransferase